jgi:AhpD family alkylhydroperoxidase
MRLQILDSGHGFGTRTLFAFIRAASRQPVLDVIKLVRYRPDFYGKPMSAITHGAMRGHSSWSVADRELMAAFVAKTNQCDFCVKTHSAVADLAYRVETNVAMLLCDLTLAGIGEPLRATMLMLRKLTKEHAVDADDMRGVLAAGASAQQIEDALAICFSFDVIVRIWANRNCPRTIVAVNADRKQAPLKVYVSYLKPHGLADESPRSIEKDRNVRTVRASIQHDISFGFCEWP